MPRANIYIRNEDWQIWSSIQNKSELIHTMIKNIDELGTIGLAAKKAVIPPAPQVKSGSPGVFYNSTSSIPQPTPVKENKFPPSAASML